MREEEGQAKRKRGGQAGNQNARKHGFYSKSGTPLEAEDLNACLEEGLGSEIAMLRVFVRRVFSLGQQVNDPELAIRYMRALGMSAVHLAALMKAEQMLSEGESSSEDVLFQALADVQREMKLQ